LSVAFSQLASEEGAFFKMTMLLLLCVSSVMAHVIFTNAGNAAAGSEQEYELTVEHGTTDAVATHIVEVTFPRGVLSARPRNVPLWDTIIETRVLPPEEQYVNDDGELVNTTVSKVTFKAQTPDAAITNEESESFVFSIDLGCKFTDPVSNTYWQATYALWFPVRQYLATAGTLNTVGSTDWTGTCTGNQVWALATPNPSPYLLVSNWSSCSAFTWLGVAVPQIPAAAVVDYVAASTFQAKLDAGLNSVYARSNADLRDSVSTLNAQVATAQSIAIAAVVLAVLAIVALVAAVIGGVFLIKKKSSAPVSV
jgi:uncharacterized protein YcnI